MRKLILFMHVSLDSFVCGPKGEMNWIHLDDEIFDFGHQFISATDTALYGRVTYQMMENYWPTAGMKENASKHDIEHSLWYKDASKIVISSTLQQRDDKNTLIISDNFTEKINEIKMQQGSDILIFGSPSTAHFLMELDLIDGYRLNVNPVLIGNGTPLFKNIHEKQNLALINSHTFSSGVIAVYYEKKGRD